MTYAIVSFIIVTILTPFVLNLRRFSSPIKPELEEHMSKAGTPGVGSLAIYPASMVAFLIGGEGSVRNLFIIALTLAFLVGFIDDALKVIRRSPDGMKSLTKLCFQIASSIIVSYLVRREGLYQELSVFLYYPLAVLLIVVFLNAANITDGLDTLEVKSVLPVLFLSALLYKEMELYSLSFALALCAFLLFNSSPAAIFMGDGGSHMCGMMLAVISLLSGEPWVIIISSILMFIELSSSFIQIVAIRKFHRKVFTIAPIHHALQKRGVSEERITDSFLSITVLSSLIAYQFSARGGAV